MFDASLLNLPWPTLVTLACGYIGYFIANVGVKEHHQPVEVTFSTLIFGLFPLWSITLSSGLVWMLTQPPFLQ